MKITLDIPDESRCISITLVTEDAYGLMMRNRMFNGLHDCDILEIGKDKVDGNEEH